MNEVRIPQLVKVQCGTCGSQQVVEQGQQALCQPCVNNFLARNVGVMAVVTEPEPEVEDRSARMPPLPAVDPNG